MVFFVFLSFGVGLLLAQDSLKVLNRHLTNYSEYLQDSIANAADPTPEWAEGKPQSIYLLRGGKPREYTDDNKLFGVSGDACPEPIWMNPSKMEAYFQNQIWQITEIKDVPNPDLILVRDGIFILKRGKKEIIIYNYGWWVATN